MLGVPCAGKGTLCSMLSNAFDNIGFISAGDCLREARNDDKNPHCQVINKHINAGTIVPGLITASLIHLQMNHLYQHKGITKIIIDGFPRTFENLSSFKNEFNLNLESINAYQNKFVKIVDVINLEVDINIAKERLKKRAINQKRSDDINDTAVFNRIKVYLEETTPVLDELKKNDLG